MWYIEMLLTSNVERPSLEQRDNNPASEDKDYSTKLKFYCAERSVGSSGSKDQKLPFNADVVMVWAHTE